MIIQTLTLGLIIGMIHFVVVGIFYGNPFVDRIYQDAQKIEPGVRKWPSRGKYLLFQFLGTQIEVFILTLGFLWIRPHIPFDGISGGVILGLLFAAIRVYPRFWNMWIQSTYPNRLLGFEFVGGIVSTLTIVCSLQLLAGGI
jgi:hypothetical protein